MVSSAKMLVKTGTPSAGQPVPVERIAVRRRVGTQSNEVQSLPGRRDRASSGKWKPFGEREPLEAGKVHGELIVFQKWSATPRRAIGRHAISCRVIVRDR